MKKCRRSSVLGPLLAFAILDPPPAVAQGDAGREEAAVRKAAFTFVGRALDNKNKDAPLDGRPPLDRVDTLASTHAHPDHFDPALVVRCLERHPKSSFQGLF